MIVLIKTLQVILALSVLIIIHEFGHFAFAKMFGIRVDKFFLFFDIGDVKLFSTKSKWFIRLFPKAAKWQTEYGIGWLPLGGYCKINGMVDESMDLDALKGEAQPWEFRTHPAWQRLMVMAGGVFNNFVFAILAYVLILTIWGSSYVSNEGSRIWVDDLAYEMGFRNGDHIISFDGRSVENFGMIQADLARREVHKATVLRGTDTVTLYMDQSMISQVLQTPSMFTLAVPFVIDTVPPESVNGAAGLEKMDRIVSVGGQDVEFVQEARPILSAHAGDTVGVRVQRGADTLAMALQVDTLGRLGVYMQMPSVQIENYNFWKAVPAGFRLAGSTIGGYLRDLKLVATPSTGAYKSVGSFISIGQVFPSRWDWYQFMSILALLSIMLGVMNLLPIPGLDGGHIVITLYEMVSGRKPGQKFLVGAQLVGMFLLFLLMILAFGNDIFRLIH